MFTPDSPKTDLAITLVQTSLHWQQPEKNRQMLEQKLQNLPYTDLVILPEMFTTGFSMQARELAEPTEGPTLAWMRKMAQEKAAVITGSLIVVENQRYFNRLFWVRPDGGFDTYDKRHLFRMAQEDQTYTAGNRHLLTELNGWRICPLICYDLRFPVWSRNTFGYDLLLYVANWPERRSLAWRTLLHARAIENLAYVAGVNRVGDDQNGISYSGDSAVHGPEGDTLFWLAHEEYVKTLTLSAEKLRNFRMRFPANLDADKFTLEV